jgi:hypothetical protein
VAVVVASIAGGFAFATYRNERAAVRLEREAAKRERDAFDRDRERDKQEQAARVAVWPNKAHRSDPSFGLINGSAAPVWSVEVLAYAWGGGRTEHELLGKFDVGVTPPYGAPRYFRTRMRALDFDKAGYLYALSFRDNSNNWWHRTEGGLLRENAHPAARTAPLLASPELPGHGSPDESFSAWSSRSVRRPRRPRR